MNILVEALHINFDKITGIERHFYLQLELFAKISTLEKILIVHVNEIQNHNICCANKEVSLVKISSNNIEEWESVYSNYSFDFVYSTFVPPAILPPQNKPLFYVLHDPGRYLFPELMDSNFLSSHVKLFEKYIKSPQFKVITVSYSSRKDIIKLFPPLKEKVFVVYNFISEGLASHVKAPNVSVFEKEKYFLTIGRFSPTKNTLSIVKAFENRTNLFNDYKLIIIGRQGYYSEFESYIANNNPSNIIIYNSVDETKLTELYKNAYGYISASLYEGFGMTLIEALHFGCKRVFCSSIPVFKELSLPCLQYFDHNSISNIVSQVFTYHIDYNTYCHQSQFTKELAFSQFQNILKSI